MQKKLKIVNALKTKFVIKKKKTNLRLPSNIVFCSLIYLKISQ